MPQPSAEPNQGDDRSNVPTGPTLTARSTFMAFSMKRRNCRRRNSPRRLSRSSCPADRSAALLPTASHWPVVNPADSRLEIFDIAACIIDKHLQLLQKRDPRELSNAIGRSSEIAQQAIEFIRTLDPRPGQRYNRSDARLIEPDVAFVKRGDEYVVVMNEEDLPTLRLNQGYRRMLTQEGAEKEVKDYVKERYRSALQLMRNIEQRKNTILRTCEAIVRRQGDFLEKGVEALRPMMIKEVAEEIGVHPSTVSRAVSNKYVHTAQGVLRAALLLFRGCQRPRRGRHPAHAAQAQGEKTDRRRRSQQAAHRRPDRQHAAGPGH